MARIFLDIPFMTLSGQMKKSDGFYYMTRNGKTFMCAKGERTKPFSQAEKETHERFRRANEWANLVQRSDELILNYTKLWHQSSIQCHSFRGWLIKYYYQHFPSPSNQQSPINNQQSPITNHDRHSNLSH